MRILALDWGTVRIGAAISDPDGILAFPLDKHVDASNAEEDIKNLVTEYRVEKIIIGLPKTLSGETGVSAVKSQEFMEKLKENIFCDFEMVDERLTSAEAEKKLTLQGINGEKQRSILDNIAAQIMLQQYLDTHKNN